MDPAGITCIAVDDEPSALRIIEKFASKTPDLNLLRTFRSPVEAISFLNSNQVQLVFLDINMPEMTGIEFVQSLHNPPLIIFSTAYSEFALESYDYDVLDYLLKPIAFPRFLKAVNKAVSRMAPNETQSESPVEPITLKDSGSHYQIYPDEILYLESLGNYLKLFTTSQSIVIKSGLQQFLDDFPTASLTRVHKSFAVSSSKISKMSYSHLSIAKHEIPIGRKYREQAREAFGAKL